MEQIVLGYDGSVASESALEWVADRAGGGRAAIEVVLVTNSFLADGREAREHLSVAARRLRDLVPGLPVEVTRLDGVMPSSMTDAARGADLLVLGVHPGSRVRSMLNGWVPLRVASRSHIPTALVPPGWSATADPVTVGIDDDDSSAGAVLFAAGEAAARQVPLRVVHSWLMGTPDLHGATASQRGPHEIVAAHKRIVDSVILAIRDLHPDLAIHSELVRDNPASTLTRAAEASSLVVIGTHGRGVFAGGLLGSVGMDLIGALSRPICVVPAGWTPR